LVYNRKFIDVDVDARVLVELPLRAHEREPRGHRTTGACSTRWGGVLPSEAMRKEMYKVFNQ
tara:strand:+ start:1268 stop:1453 length:186 start_codon:yes stop_codon:yes gene_type:complete